MGIWGKILLPPLMDFASYAPGKAEIIPPLQLKPMTRFLKCSKTLVTEISGPGLG